MEDELTGQINLFRSLFRGREDVFAIRWEKGSKSGYMPAYLYDPYMYRAHKVNGGTFQNYTNKSYLKLSDAEIVKHLKGQQHIGLYPLLTDNTSWFIAADFDGKDWEVQCKSFISFCEGKSIPAYLERSRSGNGGHIWIFFEIPYPAIRSRKILLNIMQKLGIISLFDKSSSFDRLFPNQDFLSGKGLGNLIALPLFKTAYDLGNSCFIDPNTFLPIEDQYDFMSSIQRITTERLDELYMSLIAEPTPFPEIVSSGKLTIKLNNEVKISRVGLTMPLIDFLKEELNFANTSFIVKKKTGNSTHDTERHFKMLQEGEQELSMPRGFIGKLIRFCRENDIEHAFLDQRKKHEQCSYGFEAILRNDQQTLLKSVLKKDFGVIVAPPGAGKTILAMKIIAERAQPALVVVHRQQLIEQWMDRVEAFLGIPRNEIGRIGQGKNKIGKQITIATIQSLAKELEKEGDDNINKKFGIVIVDECHHVPAETFRNAMSKIQAYYIYGLTATPFRKYNDGKLIFTFLGEIVGEIKPTQLETAKHPKIIVRNTQFEVPFNPKIDKFETLSKILIHDTQRNQIILGDISNELKQGRKAVVITERKEHIETLALYLRQKFEVLTMSGEDSESSRKAKWSIQKGGNYQVLITTGQFFGEGTDLHTANCLFLVYPFSFEGKLIQYIGRVQRSDLRPTIYDYHDSRIAYLHRMFLKRNAYYRKIERTLSLFDEPEENVVDKKILIIEQNIKIPFEKLTFNYGCLSFKYYIEIAKIEVEFEMDHPEMRPEFEVLKPYFVKVLRSSLVSIEIFAEFEAGLLVSQLAQSDQLSRINKEMIEGVKFRFVSKNILGMPTKPAQHLLTIDDLLKNEQSPVSLYQGGTELLDDLLKQRDFKHSLHLRYLAELHEGTVLKIRFVLSPFSFVFLLAGKEQYHIVLETLDTDEATYIWHLEKDKMVLRTKLAQVERDLNMIHDKGRQLFLETNPQDFSRVLHDYSEARKGFMIWKGLLDEKLF